MSAGSVEGAKQVHSNVNKRIENIKRGMGMEKDKIIKGVAQGASHAISAGAQVGVNLSTGMGMPIKIKKVKSLIKKTISHNGRTYRYVGKTQDLRIAQQKITSLKEKGRPSVVKDLVYKGNDYLAVYAIPAKKKVTA